MNRRKFLQAALAAPVVASVPAPINAPAPSARGMVFITGLNLANFYDSPASMGWVIGSSVAGMLFNDSRDVELSDTRCSFIKPKV